MTRGQLRVYLGAAPGVGKTYAMLNEGRRRRDRGTDIVIGYVETHDREVTAEQIADLEIVPRVTLAYRGSMFEEMDLDAVLARQPEVVLVDELAHTNVPGSRNEKRWQDVQELLDAGIDVISTVNVQHLESLNDVVEAITGIQQRETVPDEVVRAAEQIELVDMTPEALRRRMAHGNIYAADRVDAALASYFRAGNLGALRELALLWVADQVDEALLRYRDQHGIDRPWEARERVVVALTGAPSGEQLIRRAARMAQRSHGDLLGLHVRPADGRADAPAELLERHRQLLDDLGGAYHELVAADIVSTLCDFARHENATQLVLGASRRSRWSEVSQGSIINQIIRQAGPIDVHVISTAPDTAEHAPRTRSSPVPVLGRRRRATGWVVATVGTTLLTVLFANIRSAFGQGSHFLLYQAVVIIAAVVGGAAPAVAAALLASAALNWYFTPPFHTWTVDDPENALALVVFLIVGVLASLLVTALARQTADARRGRAEAEALARIAGGLVTADDPLPPMLERVRTLLGLDAIAVYGPDGTALAHTGDSVDPAADSTIDLPDGRLAIRGALGPDDKLVLEAFTAQLATVLERRRLRQEAANAAALAEADSFRTALLRAVSHDLRTPLASIKASVTSLLQRDVDWSRAESDEFLATIDEEADRLDNVIGNLLDASRLEAGALLPAIASVALDEVVPSALTSVSGLCAGIDIDIDPSLPLVLADAGLLERAIANIAANADRADPRGTIRIAASQLGDHVELRIVDHGPGIPAPERTTMFQPFQRLGDTTNTDGVGLGLAVAKGIIDAMGGALDAEDTPGGGLTMVITLPAQRDAC